MIIERAVKLLSRFSRAQCPVVVFYVDGKFRSAILDADTERSIEKNPSRVVGVYDNNVQLDDLVEDLEYAESRGG